MNEGSAVIFTNCGYFASEITHSLDLTILSYLLKMYN
jgi:hypothetical protein